MGKKAVNEGDNFHAVHRQAMKKLMLMRVSLTVANSHCCPPLALLSRTGEDIHLKMGPTFACFELFIVLVRKEALTRQLPRALGASERLLQLRAINLTNHCHNQQSATVDQCRQSHVICIAACPHTHKKLHKVYNPLATNVLVIQIASTAHLSSKRLLLMLQQRLKDKVQLQFL